MECPCSAQIVFVAIECYDDAPVHDLISALANEHPHNIVQAKVIDLDETIRQSAEMLANLREAKKEKLGA